MWRTLACLVGVVFIAGLIAGPVLYYLHLEAQVRNFRVVQEGVLYRSGQMTRDGLKRVVHDHKIRTVITLRDADNPGDPPPDLEEEEFCKKMGLGHYRLRPAVWWAKEGPPPADVNVARFRQVLDDPSNHPVLVHCFAGVHRTGAYCALFRMEYQGWSNSQAIAEMKAMGYDNVETERDVFGYLEKYVPTWRSAGLDAPPGFGRSALGRQVRP
jgi:tyrosine-protein phosphatase SIW14